MRTKQIVIFLAFVAVSTAVLAQTTPAGNVSSGTFGSNTGGGDYTFTRNLNVGGGTAGDLVLLRSDSTGPYVGSFNGVPLRLGVGYLEKMRIDSTGNVGIGTTTPLYPLDVVGTIKFGSGQGAYITPRGYLGSTWAGTDGYRYAFLGSSNFNGTNWITAENGGFGSNFVSEITLDGGGLVRFYTQPTTGNAQRTDSPSTFATYERMRIDSGGNVGIGTTSPGAKLDVNGSVRLSGPGSSLVFSDGTVQSTAWTGSLCGGDYAEAVDVSDRRDRYEPGDLLAIDPQNPGKFLKSSQAYSTAVAGVYSTKPGVIGRRQAVEQAAQNPEVPMAMVGIVPTKVSAENGPIKPGDILVSASLAGHAMKGTDPQRMMGAVLGKALGNLAAGTGVIEVLVSLQ